MIGPSAVVFVSPMIERAEVQSFRRANGNLRHTGELDIYLDLVGAKIAALEAEEVRVAPSNSTLAREIDCACRQLRMSHSLDSLRRWESISAVRDMIQNWGFEPSKYRPSSEAMLRRVLKGHSVPPISTVVDIGNWGAIETGWPYGCYDRTKLFPPIRIRRGEQGERYEAIGRRLLSLEGRPVFSDIDGAFGSPVSDSTRTMITEATRKVLILICIPNGSHDAVVNEAVTRLTDRLVSWCGACITRRMIVTSTCISGP